MRSLIKLTWVELKLFVREPLTVVFTFALPLIFLFVLAGVFGNTPDEEEDVFRGVGPTDYYVPAYIGLVLASIGLIALPVHLAGYRQNGVLRRMRASSVPFWSVFGSQVIVSFLIGLLGGILLVVAALLAYDIQAPESPAALVAAFVMSVLSFASLGVLLGAVLPTARAAQGAGLILFFVMFLLSGAGPPPEVMTDAMQRIREGLPLTYGIELLQDPWLGFGWDGVAWLAVAGTMVVSTLVSVRVFRWE